MECPKVAEKCMKKVVGVVKLLISSKEMSTQYTMCNKRSKHDF